jgi:hypothetical protein
LSSWPTAALKAARPRRHDQKTFLFHAKPRNTRMAQEHERAIGNLQSDRDEWRGSGQAATARRSTRWQKCFVLMWGLLLSAKCLVLAAMRP